MFVCEVILTSRNRAVSHQGARRGSAGVGGSASLSTFDASPVVTLLEVKDLIEDVKGVLVVVHLFVSK